MMAAIVTSTYRRNILRSSYPSYLGFLRCLRLIGSFRGEARGQEILTTECTGATMLSTKAMISDKPGVKT